jgi:hypothetical protein
MTVRHADLTHHELRAQLKRQGHSVPEQEYLLTEAQLLRRQRAADALFTRIHRDEWRAILTPLRQEWNNARSSAAYDPSDALRVDVFMEYAEVLEHTRLHLLGRMMAMREMPMTFDEYVGNGSALSSAEIGELRSVYEADKPVKYRRFTPSELAKHMTERYKRDNKGFPVPNNGVHWVDWISPKLRRDIDEKFEAWLADVPRKKHARMKEPFKRVDAPDKFEDKRQSLLAVAEKELERLTRLHMIAEQSFATRKAQAEDVGRKLKENRKDLHVRLADRVAKATRACFLLKRWERDDGALPRTWHGVLKS